MTSTMSQKPEEGLGWGQRLCGHMKAGHCVRWLKLHLAVKSWDGGRSQSSGRRDKPGKSGQQSEPRPTESKDELEPNPGSLLGLYRSATFQGLHMDSSPHPILGSPWASEPGCSLSPDLISSRFKQIPATLPGPNYICPRVKSSSEIQSSLYLSQQQLRTGKEPERVLPTTQHIQFTFLTEKSPVLKPHPIVCQGSITALT